MILIEFDKLPTDLIVNIDNNNVTYNVEQNSIRLNPDINFGFHMLTMEASNTDYINIIKFNINGSELRHTKYLSWVKHPDKRVQPATYLVAGTRFYLPFINPPCMLYGYMNKKMLNGELGKDLSEKYELFYPESIKISDEFPSWVREFYLYNFDFTIRDKSDIYNFPYREYTEEYVVNPLIFDEAERLFQTEPVIHPPSTQLDRIDDPAKDQYWEKINIFYMGNYVFSNEKTKYIKEFIQSLPYSKITYCMVAKLEPGCYISPHIDGVGLSSECSQLYLALNWPDGNLFKMQNVGLVPIEEMKPIWLNTNGFAHSVINNSDQTRYILNVWVDLSSRK